MKNETSLNPKARKVLAALRKIGPFLPASLTTTQKKCGRPACRCAKDGPIHETALLTWKEAGTTQTLYVPRELRPQVRQWIAEWRKLKELIEEMGSAQRDCLRTLRKRKKSSSKSP